MNPLALDIINNMSKHQVNRAEKHDRTLEVMANNLIKKEQQLNGETRTQDVNYGYGNKKLQGD